MKNDMIRKGWDAANPTQEQKERMRAAIAAQLPAENRRVQEEQERPLEELYSVQPQKKKRSYQPRYDTKVMEKPRRGSWIGPVAAMLAAAVACGLMLSMMLNAPQEDIHAVSPTRPTQVTLPPAEETQPQTVETQPQAKRVPEEYQQILNQYVTAIEEQWQVQKLWEEGLSELIQDVYRTDILGYSLLDLDGNGVEELLITDGEHLYNLYTLTEEGPVCLVNGSARIWYHLSEGNIICMEASAGAATRYYDFYQVQGAELVTVDAVMYDAGRDLENPWFHGNINVDPDTMGIPASKAQQIIDGYPAIYIRNIPLSCGTEAYIQDDYIPEDIALFQDLIREEKEFYTYSEPMTYTFCDFDGDGEREFLIGSGNAIRSVYDVENGQAERIFTAASQSYVYLCENNILQEQSMRGIWMTTMDGEVVEFLHYSEETGSWYMKNKEKTPDVPIDEETKNEVYNSFRRVPMDWKPISQFDEETDAGLYPLALPQDIAAAERAVFTASFGLRDILVDDWGNYSIHMSVYKEDLFESSWMLSLEPGDVLVLGGQRIPVQSVSQTDWKVSINGGMDAGGYTFISGNSGYYFDRALWYGEEELELFNEVTLPIGDSFRFYITHNAEDGASGRNAEDFANALRAEIEAIGEVNPDTAKFYFRVITYQGGIVSLDSIFLT